MAGRRVNPRLVKIHHSYAAGELADLFRVHKNTINHWRKEGLKPIDELRPVLFHGTVVRQFLERRRRTSKQPCANDELYCLRCRTPKRPTSGTVKISGLPFGGGNVRGQCSDCQGTMYRRISEAQAISFS
jgi:hypothetical protein